MFRITIRDFLWLILVAALTLSWTMTERRARQLAAEKQYLSEVLWLADVKPDRHSRIVEFHRR